MRLFRRLPVGSLRSALILRKSQTWSELRACAAGPGLRHWHPSQSMCRGTTWASSASSKHEKVAGFIAHTLVCGHTNADMDSWTSQNFWPLVQGRWKLLRTITKEVQVTALSHSPPPSSGLPRVSKWPSLAWWSDRRSGGPPTPAPTDTGKTFPPSLPPTQPSPL